MNSIHGNDGEVTRYGNNNSNLCNVTHSNVLDFPYEKDQLLKFMEKVEFFINLSLLHEFITRGIGIIHMSG
jgi:hypothetical protein